jgi:hypothetical protein
MRMEERKSQDFTCEEELETIRTHQKSPTHLKKQPLQKSQAQQKGR